MLDVIVDPRQLHQPTFLYGAERLEADLRVLLPEAVANAQRDWKRGSTYAGMLELIREIREQHTNCFGYNNYTQLPLAFAFLAAKDGDMSLAERELDEHLKGDWLSEVEAGKLKRLLRANAE
jgi:hypothetical protein